MHVHRAHMSDLIKKYARNEPDLDAVVRKEIATWRNEIACGTTVTLPGMPGGSFNDLSEFDIWRETRFPRLYFKRG